MHKGLIIIVLSIIGIVLNLFGFIVLNNPIFLIYLFFGLVGLGCGILVFWDFMNRDKK